MQFRVARVRAWVSAHPGLAVIVVAAMPRALVVLASMANDAVLVSTDSAGYLALADHPSGYWDSGASTWSLALRRPPGYPTLLAAPRVLSDGVLLVGWLQAAVSVVVAWLTWVVGRELAGRRVGLLAGLWVAVDPTTVVQSGRVLTEAPFTALLVVAVLLLHRAVRRDSTALAAQAGVTLAAATFIRPISLYLPLIIPLVVLVGRRRSAVRARPVRLATAVCVAFAIPVGAWIAHVHAMTGVPMFSTIEGVNMLEYRAAGAVAVDEGISISEARRRLLDRLETRLEPGMNPAEVARAKRDLGMEVVRDHPIEFARTAATGLARALVGSSRSSMVEVTEDLPAGSVLEKALTAAGLVSAVLMLGGAVAGGFVLARRRELLVLALTAIPIAYQLGIGSGADSYSRFRVSCVPLLAILAVIGANSRRRR